MNYPNSFSFFFFCKKNYPRSWHWFQLWNNRWLCSLTIPEQKCSWHFHKWREHQLEHWEAVVKLCEKKDYVWKAQPPFGWRYWPFCLHSIEFHCWRWWCAYVCASWRSGPGDSSVYMSKPLGATRQEPVRDLELHVNQRQVCYFQPGGRYTTKHKAFSPSV